LPRGGRWESEAALGDADAGRCLERRVDDDEPGRGCIYRSFCAQTLALVKGGWWGRGALEQHNERFEK
jgi:hypothetical protein